MCSTPGERPTKCCEVSAGHDERQFEVLTRHSASSYRRPAAVSRRGSCRCRAAGGHYEQEATTDELGRRAASPSPHDRVGSAVRIHTGLHRAGLVEDRAARLRTSHDVRQRHGMATTVRLPHPGAPCRAVSWAYPLKADGDGLMSGQPCGTALALTPGGGRHDRSSSTACSPGTT